jgi:UDP-2,4-diacetamido-2,4,6-trideoxy-beta-L-altropyranose hydrolase
MINLLVRADGDIRMGTGHLMRCLALGQAWQRAGGQAAFASARLSPGLEAQLANHEARPETVSAEPGTPEDAAETVQLAGRLQADWVVLDGYHFSSRFQQAIKDAGHRLLVIDDYGHAEHYWADLVLNQNLHAAEALYRRRGPQTRLLLGTRFALLRREFWDLHGWERAIPKVARKVLVTLGGSDPDNVTAKIIQGLQKINGEGFDAVVVAGTSNPHLSDLEAVLAGGKSAIHLRTSVTDMPGLMAWADVAVAAGGTTSWERARMGLPSLVVVLADNQRELAEALEQVGIGWNLGPHQLLSVTAVAEALERLMRDPEARARMARCGPELVDGQGATRVVRKLRDSDVWLRPARADDCRLIWEWANEPSARAASFSTEGIPWERHQQWFAAKLNDPGCTFFIAVNGSGVPIGQLRCDVSDSTAVISISLDPRFRGTGYGTKMLREGSEELFERGNVNTIHAFIRHGNDASYRAFEKAGFRRVEDTIVQGQPASLLVLRKGQQWCHS